MASWKAMRLQVCELLALLCLLVVRCSAITCHCNTTAPIFVNLMCLHNGYMCATTSKCYALRHYIAESDSIVTDWDCFDPYFQNETLVEAFCNGSRNSADIAYQCCDNADRCNRDLDVRLPRETVSSSSVSTTIALSPTSTSSSALLLHPTTSTVPLATPIPTATATADPVQSSPTPVSPERLTCYCNASSPSQVPSHCTESGYSCQTDHACYVKRFHHNNGLVYTRWGCYDPTVSEGVSCSGQLDSNTVATVCCNDSFRCNKFLEVPELLTDVTPSTHGSETDPDSDNLFLWLTIAVLAMLALVFVATGIICLVVVVHYNRLTRKLKSDKILFKR